MNAGVRESRWTARMLVPGVILGILSGAMPGMIAGCGEDEPSRAEAVAGTTPPPSTDAEVVDWFATDDESGRPGLDFTVGIELDEAAWLPEIMIGGGAAFDHDDDGWMDLYLLQGSGPGGNRLFRNLEGRGFEDVTEGSGLGHGGYGSGVATGDYDGDGDVDVFVTNVGPDVLFRNEGDGTFTDVTASSGLGDAGWGTSATFFDLDDDGDLDLFVCRYIDWAPDREKSCRNVRGDFDYCHPLGYEAPMSDLLYRNDGGVFVDVSESSGIASEKGNGLGVAAADFDGDDRLDLFVANDQMPDRLWLNQGDGTFVESAFRMGCDRDMTGLAKAGMGVSTEDVDDDGDLDLLVCNIASETDSFYLNQGGRFVDSTNRAGIGSRSRPFTRFGLGLVDLDNDAVLDYFAANGAVAADLDAEPGRDPYAQPNLVLHGRRDRLGFEPVEPEGGVLGLTPRTSRAAIFVDLDNDGGLDVVTVNLEAPTRLLRNVVPDRGHWLLLDVRNDVGAPAIAARVTADLGDRTLTRFVRTDSSYLAARDPRVHLGLGDIEVVPSIEVRWPDGRTRRLESVEVDRVIRIDPPADE